MVATARTVTDADRLRWRADIDSDCIRASFGHLPNIAGAAMVTSAVIVLIVRGLLPDARLFGWGAAVWLNSGVRFWMYRRFHARPRSDDELVRWSRWFLLVMSVASLTYGSIVFMTEGDPPLLLVAVLSLAIGGHIAGGSQSLVATPHILLASALFSVSPLLIVMAVSNDANVRWLLVMVLSYLASVAAMARVNYRSMRDSMILGYQNLELAERLAAQSADKTRFLAAASHDLRQPLYALGLFASALEGEATSDRAKHLLTRIATSREALQQLLDGLLDVSRLDAGVVTARVRPFALDPVLRSIEGLFADAAKARGLTLQVASTSAWVDSDPDMVAQILQNLVANAIRYTASGSVAIDVVGTRLEVRDTGIGIPPEERAAIFREFHQLGNPERDRSKGVGLGLAIVERLARLLGTHIELTSEVGKGSTFALALPPASPAPALAPAPAPARAPARTVLVVEDDALAREALTLVLETWGHRVVFDPHDHADAALVDLRLPKSSGLTIVAELAARDIPALIVTGETDPARIREAYATGRPVLFKPVDPAELRAALDRLAGPVGAIA